MARINEDRTVGRRQARAMAACSKSASAETAILALLVVALLTAVWLGSSSGRCQSLETSSLRIEAGDTLWSIATAHPVPGLSTAQTAELLTDINGLDGAMLAAGSTVQVPLADDRATAQARR